MSMVEDYDGNDYEAPELGEVEGEPEGVDLDDAGGMEDDRPLVLLLAAATGDVSDIITDYLGETAIASLGSQCVEDWRMDDGARNQWKTQTEAALSAAAQDAPGDKTYPFDRSANVQYPLITVAAQQFAARAYPAIVKPGDAVSVAVLGRDADGQKQARADRVKDYLNYQLFYRIADWEGDTDVLLNQLPISGCGFRKVYYDAHKRRPCSEFVNALNLTVPSDAKALKDAPRITQDFEVFPYQITERQRSGMYRDVDTLLDGDADDQSPRQFIEQHRMHDLDGDGVEEPYIITVDVESTQVMRIEAAYDELDLEIAEDGRTVIRIERWCPFVKYSFLPDPKGRFYDIGFGHLLAPINAVVNTIINQLLDAGHAQVAGGGFLAAGLRLQGSGQTNVLRFSPSEYKVVNVPGGDIRNSIYDRPMPGPSPVLFELLGMLMDAARDISSVKDVLTGEAGKSQTATATLALIEQGLQTFTAIYKRIYRSAKQEFQLLYDCVSRYGDPDEYARVLDIPGATLAKDFNEADLDIQPVADPASVTNMQRMAKAGFLQGFLGKGLNDEEILKRIFEAADIADIEKLFPPKPEGPPPPNPLMIADIREKESKAGLNEATAAKNRADAMDKLSLVAERGVTNGVGGLGAVAQPPGDGMGVGGPEQGGFGPA
jgi:chaperonin GroES